MAETPFFLQSMGLFFLQPRYGDMYKQWLVMSPMSCTAAIPYIVTNMYRY